METCYGEEKSGFPVQPEEKIRKNRVFWSTYRESSYHTFDNSVVRHIRCLPRNLNGIFSSQMVKRSMGEPFWKGRLNGLIRLVSYKNRSYENNYLVYYAIHYVWPQFPPSDCKMTSSLLNSMTSLLLILTAIHQPPLPPRLRSYLMYGPLW